MNLLFVVPTLGRRPETLRQALLSVRDQQVEHDVDLVVVAPQGSVPRDLLQEVGGREVADPGGGIAAALNAGLASATEGTRYFAWLGDDDLLRPGSLARTAHALDQSPDAVLVYGWCDYIDTTGATVFRSRAGRLARVTLPFGPNLVPQPGSLMRYDAVVAAGGLDESIRLALDLDLFLRLRHRGRIISLPHTLAAFRWHRDSATVANGSESMEESDQVRMRYMSRPGAAVYRVARWPGRWALSAAKWRVDRATARAAAPG